MRLSVLWPLTPAYAAAVYAKNRAYERGWLHSQRLRWPVVSVGNISVGGAGKTPLVIRLAELLTNRGVSVDVLSRGYGRASRATERVDADGSAERFGDEPLLIARCTGVPVYVGASRYDAGLLAERELPGPRVHLLDDGFQHRRLDRDVDIAVVHRSDFAEPLLPAGRMREPLAALRRASIVVLRNEDAALGEVLREHGIEAPVWLVTRNLEIPGGVRRAIVFCGIAHPDEFVATLRGRGIQIAASCAFRDHHRYSTADIDRLTQLASRHAADAFVTTEKDAVRLTLAQKQRLERAAPFKTAHLRVSLRDEDEALQYLLALLPVTPDMRKS